MAKIFVTGNAGAGKSTLSKEIARRRGMAWYGLDQIVWQENWRKTPAAQQKAEIAKLMAQDVWVIDGVDYDILEAADEVVFLDLPRRVCFYRAFKRNWWYLFSSRPELPKNCPEILILPTLIKIVWRFPKRVRPKILAHKVRRSNGSFIHIRNAKELKVYLDKIT